MSVIEVNKLTPLTNNGTITLGDSGDTFSIPSGVTLSNAGTATGFSDMVLLSTVDAGTGTSAVVFNSSVVTSTYKHFYLICHKNTVTTSEATVKLYFSHDNGSNFAGATRKTQIYQQLTGTGTGKEAANATGFVQLGSAHSSAANVGGGGNIFLNSLGYTGYKYINFVYAHMAASDPYTYNGSFELQNTAVINYLKLVPSTGNIKGIYSLYGVKN